MSFTIGAAFTPLKKLLGVCYPESVIIFKDKKVTWLMDAEDFSKSSQDFVQRNIFNNKRKKMYSSEWNRKTSLLQGEFNLLNEINFTSLTQEDLNQKFEHFSEIYFLWWTLTISVELITTSIEPLLGKGLKDYYKDEQVKEFNKDFAILTSPLALTFYRQEQKDLLEILALPNKKWGSALKAHQQNYFWMYNSYLKAKKLNVNYFRKEAEKFAKTKWKPLFEEINNYSENTKFQKSQIIKRLYLKREVRDLISLVEKFAQFQDQRKALNFKSDHYLQIFVDEYARRLKIKSDDLKMLLFKELTAFSDELKKNLIKKRKECFVLVCKNTGIKHFVGSKALFLHKRFGKVRKIKESMIHGRVASVGKEYHFRGTAKVVLTIKEIGKVKKGDVLVTTMTSPDFVIGMKKAIAIITDTGGILSHAAIVSRELKKPCIVGTEVATKVIHDGDIVEIHSGRGTVRIVKHEGN